MERQQGATGEREDDHPDRVDVPGHDEAVHAAVHAMAEADGGVADDRLEAVAARGRSRQHGEVGQVVHARHHADQRRHALRQRRRRRWRGACSGGLGWDYAAGRARRRRGVVERRGAQHLVCPAAESLDRPRFGRLHSRCRSHRGQGEEKGDELVGRHRSPAFGLVRVDGMEGALGWSEIYSPPGVMMANLNVLL